MIQSIKISDIHYNINKRTIDQFQFICQLGQGKYGKVYRAIHKITGMIVAIKTIPKQLIIQQRLIQPLILQLKLQIHLNHPNIAPGYGIIQSQTHLHLILQHCTSSLLPQLPSLKGNQKKCLQKIWMIMQAVSFMHANGVIHRDLKPQNILVQNDICKISDFGWATLLTKQSMRQTFCGTPMYVSPEVVNGQKYDQKADVWACGVILYQLLFGRVPFSINKATDMIKIIKQILYIPTYPQVSSQIKQIIRLMMNKNASQRVSIDQILVNQYMMSFVDTRQKSSYIQQFQELFH